MELRARGQMKPDKATGPEDVIVMEMLHELPIERSMKSRIGFNAVSLESAKRRVLGRASNRYSYGSQTPPSKVKGIRGSLAIAVMSVMAMWYSSVVVWMLNDTEAAEGCGRLHVGAHRGVFCEHLQVLVINFGAENMGYDMRPGGRR